MQVTLDCLGSCVIRVLGSERGKQDKQEENWEDGFMEDLLKLLALRMEQLTKKYQWPPEYTDPEKRRAHAADISLDTLIQPSETV